MSWLKAPASGSRATAPTQAPVKRQASTQTDPAQLGAKFLQLRDELNARLVGREKEVWAAIVALASGEPVYYEAPPGTAKTTLAELLAAGVNGRYFYYQLHEYAEPDEVLGPIDVIKLREKGELDRITTGYLPDAEIVVLDEVYRASGAMLNLLIDIVLNKRVRIGAKLVPIKALTFIFAANYRRSEEEFAAFHDRLTLRVFSGYLQDKQALLDLLDKGLDILAGNGSKLQPILTADEVRTFQRHARSVAKRIIQPVKEKLVEAVIRLRNDGIPFSDRRVVKLAYVTAVVALLNGQDSALPDDLADALRLVAPLEQSDVDRVEEVIRQLGLDTMSAIKQEIEALVVEGRRLAADILDAYARRLRGEDIDVQQLRTEVHALKEIAKRLTEAISKHTNNGKAARVIAAKRKTIEETLDQIREALKVARKLTA